MSFDAPINHMDDIFTNASATDGLDYEWVWVEPEWTWWVIIQLCLSVLGVLGNLLVIFVLSTKPGPQRSADILIHALAVADFLTSVFLLPYPKAESVPSRTWLGEFYCRFIFTSFFMWIAIVASVFTLTTISIERLIAVVYPFSFRRYFSSTRIYVNVLIVIWIAAAATNSYIPVVIRADEGGCVWQYPPGKGQWALGLFVFLVEFFIPAIVMAVAQVLTAVSLHRQSLLFRKGAVSKGGRTGSNKNWGPMQAKKRVVRMLFVVVIVFVISMAPDQCFFLGYNLGLIDGSLYTSPMHHIFIIMAIINSSANFFIYTMQYARFRESVLAIFTGSFKRNADPVFEMDRSSYTSEGDGKIATISASEANRDTHENLSPL